MTHEERSDERLCLATASDREELLELLNRNFASLQRSTAGRTLDLLAWKYDASPFGPAILPVLKIDEKIAAAGALWPMALRLQGQPIQALQACDTVVDGQYRGKGLFTKLNRFRVDVARDNGCDVIFNFPNGQSLPAYLKHGWKDASRLNWYVRPCKPLSLAALARGTRRSENIRLPEEWRITAATCRKIEEELRFSSSLVALNRIPGYWKWRFVQHPSRSYGAVGDVSTDGVVVFSVNQVADRLRELIVLEFLPQPGQHAALLRSLLSAARTLDVAYIAMAAPRGIPGISFFRKGFFPLRNKNFVALPLSKAAEDLDLGFENWDISLALHDSV